MGQTDTDELPDEAVEIIAGDPVEINLTPTRLTLSPTKLILNWRMGIRNASQNTFMFLRMWSDLTCAQHPHPSRKTTGSPDVSRARLHKWEKLGKDEEAEAAGEWHLNREDAISLSGKSNAWVMPVARFRFIGAGIAPTFINLAIGAPAGNGVEMPEALHFDDAMQIFPDLVAHQLP